MDICIVVLCSVFVGAVIGCLLTRLILKPKYAGILRVYKSEPDEEVQLYLQLDELPENISECEYVTFKIHNVTV